MALPKWMEDFFASESVRNLVKLAVITFCTWMVTYFQTQQIGNKVEQAKTEAIEEVNIRTKKSENLIQRTVKEIGVGVAAAVTNTPPAEVAPVVEEAAAEVQ